MTKSRGWLCLHEEIAAEMRGLADTELYALRTVAPDVVPVAGYILKFIEQKERDASIPETKAQATHRKRLARAARVAGRDRGQS